MSHGIYLIRSVTTSEPRVDQGYVNGWFMSYNPDDNRFYVSQHPNSDHARTFREWRNAVRYARTHTV
jgi:hypothetical protein